jgi:hypothetical protein
MELIYYLETNAARAFSHKLSICGRDARRRLYTSALSIYEIIAGTTDDDFAERQAVLLGITNAKLRIDWRSPSAVFRNSFRQYATDDPFCETVKRALSVFLGTATLEQAKECGRLRQPPVDIQTLLGGRIRLSQTYTAARAGQNASYRSTVTSDPMKSLLDQGGLGPAQAKQRLNAEIAAEIDEELLSQAAEIVAAELSRSGRDFKSEDLLEVYDGGLKYHLQASRWIQLESMVFGNLPGENDAPDILHFLYVDANAVMVSNDKLSHRIASALWPEKVVRIEQFKETGLFE